MPMHYGCEAQEMNYDKFIDDGIGLVITMPTKIPEDLVTEATVKLYVDNASKRGHTYSHPDWKKDMWSMQYNDIIRYLVARINATKLQDEYYGILPYLVGHVADKQLYRTFAKRAKHIKLDESTLKTTMRRPSKFTPKKE
jgi:hypothetical protein